MLLSAKASIQIQKVPGIVYEAIVEPGIMTNYFISASTGRMEEGKELLWQFPEFPGEFTVNVIETLSPTSIRFTWDTGSTVSISLEPVSDNSTVVRIVEGEKVYTPENLAWAIGNTEGWANFLACLKAWLEYGINLRKNAFDFMRK